MAIKINNPLSRLPIEGDDTSIIQLEAEAQSEAEHSSGNRNFVPEHTSNSFCSYISGFVDGEGCFSVSFRRLERVKMGIELRPSFSIAQKKTATNYKLLEKIRDVFEGGAIRDDNRGCYKYETRSITHIQRKVIPFFTRYPLYTSKASDLLSFCKICSLIAGKQHLNCTGLTEILDLAETMNPSGKRRMPIAELRVLLQKKELVLRSTRVN